MKCENPTFGWRRKGINPKTGKFYPPFKRSPEVVLSDCFEEVPFPCGRCFSCLKNKARDLLVRSYYESLCHKHSSFVTLTVDDDYLSDVFPNCSLDHRPFQLFMKRLRKSLGYKIRYLMCAEYGEQSLRPHYHAILFGLGHDDKQPLYITRTDPFLGTSRQMYSGFLRNQHVDDAWPFGHVYLGTVSPQSIAYVCGYTLKSFTLGRDSAWYQSRGLLPEYCKWSRRPGLGYDYFISHMRDFIRTDDLIDDNFCEFSASVNGHSMSLPMYYRNKLYLHDRSHYDMMMLYQIQCKERFLSSASDSIRDMEAIHDLQCKLETQIYNLQQRKRL